MFESAVYREIAGIAIDFLDQYAGEPVGDHLDDHLEHILKGDDDRKSASFRRAITALQNTVVNADYVVSSLHRFVRQQNMKSAVMRAVESLQDGRIDEAEVELQKGLVSVAPTFELGLNMADKESVRGLLTTEMEEEGFELGIPELDTRGIQMRRKELLLFIAPRKRGKSWFCTHCAKAALTQGAVAVVITLEMSEMRYGARFLQSFLSVGRREGKARIARLQKNKDGTLNDIVMEEVERMAIDTHRSAITKIAMRRLTRRPSLVIKQYPMQSLKIEELEAYLDGLERYHNIVPDVLIVDYPDLMFHDISNKRLELGRIFERLRGIAVKRNLAVVAPTQGNRDSEKATTVTADMASEDISKLATADAAVTYSQTKAEKDIGVARLYVAASRNESDGFQVLVTQAYQLGQFAIDSTLMTGDYSALGASMRRQDDDDDDDDDDDRPARRPR